MLYSRALAIAGLSVSQAGYRRPIGIAGRSVSVWRSPIPLYPYPHMQHSHQVQQFKETVMQGLENSNSSSSNSNGSSSSSNYSSGNPVK
jgi:hypothetical protein